MFAGVFLLSPLYVCMLSGVLVSSLPSPPFSCSRAVAAAAAVITCASLQHPRFKVLLISTHGRPIVCARSGDALWGTGKQHTVVFAACTRSLFVPL